MFDDTIVTTCFLSQSSQGIDYGNCVHCMINKSAFTGGNSHTYITLKLWPEYYMVKLVNKCSFLTSDYRIRSKSKLSRFGICTILALLMVSSGADYPQYPSLI